MAYNLPFLRPQQQFLFLLFNKLSYDEKKVSVIVYKVSVPKVCFVTDKKNVSIVFKFLIFFLLLFKFFFVGYLNNHDVEEH